MQHAEMDAEISELRRLLNNVIKLGTVAEVDHGTPPRVRVQIGKLKTEWLRWSAGRAGTTQEWDPVTIGEQVVVFSPGGILESGLVFPAIYSDQFPAPSSNPSEHLKKYPDGAVIKYDHETHALTATLPAGGSAMLTAPVLVTVNTTAVEINAISTHCTGRLTVDGLITGKAGLAVTGVGAGAAATITGDIKTTGDIKADGDVMAGDISQRGHHHIEQGDGAATSEAKA